VGASSTQAEMAPASSRRAQHSFVTGQSENSSRTSRGSGAWGQSSKSSVTSVSTWNAKSRGGNDACQDVGQPILRLIADWAPCSLAR
jgi:hypothetical protein